MWSLGRKTILFLAIYTVVLAPALSLGASLIPVPRSPKVTYAEADISISPLTHCIDGSYIRPRRSEVQVCRVDRENLKIHFPKSGGNNPCEGYSPAPEVLAKRTLIIHKIRLSSLVGVEFMHVHMVPTDELPLRGIEKADIDSMVDKIKVEPGGNTFSLLACEEKLLDEGAPIIIERAATPHEEIILGRLAEAGHTLAFTVGLNIPKLIFYKLNESDPLLVFEAFTKTCAERDDSSEFNVERFLHNWERNEHRFITNPFDATKSRRKGGGGQASGAGGLRVQVPLTQRAANRLGTSIMRQRSSPDMNRARQLVEENTECHPGGL